jgi:hypothetical protein
VNRYCPSNNREKLKQRATREKNGGEKLLLRRAKATVIIFFTFLCNRKISGENFPFDGAGLTAMECDGT